MTISKARSSLCGGQFGNGDMHFDLATPLLSRLRLIDLYIKASRNIMSCSEGYVLLFLRIFTSPLDMSS